jgi:hypothetical protein
MWIIDFGVDRTEEKAALYEAPFEYVKQHVKPTREENRREAYAERWWLHVEPRSGMRKVLEGSHASLRHRPCRSTGSSCGWTARRCRITN